MSECFCEGQRGNRAWEAESIISSEGERLKFYPRPVVIEGAVEQWLSKVKFCA